LVDDLTRKKKLETKRRMQALVDKEHEGELVADVLKQFELIRETVEHQVAQAVLKIEALNDRLRARAEEVGLDVWWRLFQIELNVHTIKDHGDRAVRAFSIDHLEEALDAAAVDMVAAVETGTKRPAQAVDDFKALTLKDLAKIAKRDS
jgi:hypothetical protein